MNVISPKNLEVINQFKKQGQKIVLAGGCFDILHIGHVIFLEKAKAQGDVLVVMLESDHYLRQTKGVQRPVHDQLYRAKMLVSLKAVDFVILLPEMKNDQDYDLLVSKIAPNVIAATKKDPLVRHKKRQAKLVGAQLRYVTGFIKDYSTSQLINKIKG